MWGSRLVRIHVCLGPICALRPAQDQSTWARLWARGPGCQTLGHRGPWTQNGAQGTPEPKWLVVGPTPSRILSGPPPPSVSHLASERKLEIVSRLLARSPLSFSWKAQVLHRRPTRGCLSTPAPTPWRSLGRPQRAGSRSRRPGVLTPAGGLRREALAGPTRWLLAACAPPTVAARSRRRSAQRLLTHLTGLSTAPTVTSCSAT